MTPGSSRLDDAFARLLARRDTQGRRRHLTLPPAGSVDFSSNSYLSLSDHPEVKRRYLALLQQSSHTDDDDGGDESTSHSHLSLGSGGSRLLDGNSHLAQDLESRIAAFHRAPAGLLFNSGFDANAGLLGCAPQPGDAVVYDELVHASVHDGMRLGRARGRMLPFAHNCVYSCRKGDEEWTTTTTSLQSTLERLCGKGGGGLDEADDEKCRDFREGHRNVFVAVEAIYSMDGDVAPLRDLVACVDACLPAGNGHVIVDEAHSTGILGERGRGLVCQLGLEDRIWARVHTFGKAMGCSGAIILCSPTTRAYLINYARTFIYTTAMARPALFAIQTTYDFLAGGSAESQRRRLQSLVRRAHARLAAVCRDVPNSVLRVPAFDPEASSSSPILPLFTTHARELARHCCDHGFLVRPIVAPTVPPGSDRVRCCFHAANTADQVDGLCRAVERWVCYKTGVEGGGGEAREATTDDVMEDEVEKERLSRL